VVADTAGGMAGRPGTKGRHVRTKILLALAIAAGGLAIASPAQAAQLPCGLGSDGNRASATCWGGYSYTWRLVTDCVDHSNVRWPVTVDTIYGQFRRGDGSDAQYCHSDLRAHGRLELR
jgi:hypothetical protein